MTRYPLNPDVSDRISHQSTAPWRAFAHQSGISARMHDWVQLPRVESIEYQSGWLRSLIWHIETSDELVDTVSLSAPRCNPSYPLIPRALVFNFHKLNLKIGY